MKNQEKTLTGDGILANAIALAPIIVECRDVAHRPAAADLTTILAPCVRED
jgi:hypothetical protein